MKWNWNNIDLKTMVEVGEEYFPEVKKLKEEAQKAELKKWAKEISLKGYHMRKASQYEGARITVKKRIPPQVKMAVSLYRTLQTKMKELELETSYALPQYSGLYKPPMFKVPETIEEEAALKTNTKKPKEEIKIEEGVTISLMDDSDIDIYIPQESVQIESPSASVIEEEKDYKKVFAEGIQERKAEEKMKKLKEENPFLVDSGSIFAEFSSPLNSKKLSKEEAKELAEKLFA